MIRTQDISKTVLKVVLCVFVVLSAQRGVMCVCARDQAWICVRVCLTTDALHSPGDSYLCVYIYMYLRNDLFIIPSLRTGGP